MLTSFYCNLAAWRTNVVSRLKGEEGGHAIEYALIAVLIALAIVGGAGALGGGINKVFNHIVTQLGAAAN